MKQGHGRSTASFGAILLALVLVGGCTAASPSASPSGGSDADAIPGGSVSIGPLPSPAGTPETTPATTPEPTPSDHWVAASDGVALTVSVDHDTVAPGAVVTFTATLRNDGSQPMDYAIPWCGGAGAAAVSVALPVDPVGKTWTGIAQTFKDYALTQGYGPGGVPALQPVSINVPAKPCRDGQVDGLLGPGESVTSSMPWKAEIVGGIGALPGTVPFTVSAGYDRQNGPPSRAPGATGPVSSWFPIYKHLTVTGTVTVVGTAPHPISAGEALDGLLANKKYSKWLKAQPQDTWSNVNLFLWSMPKAEGIMPAGPSWEIDLFSEIGVPRHWAIAFVDPYDASVISVTYCDIPCDR